MRKQLIVTAAIVLGISACGSDGGVADTAKEGDAFCKLAQSAKDANDDLDNVDTADPTEVKLVIGAAIDTLDAAVAKAPKDIVDTAQTLLDKEEDLEKLLKDYDYDIPALTQTDDWTKFQDDEAATKAGDDFKAYLNDKCGIETSDTNPPDTEASDTTPETTPSDTSPSDTAPSDTSGGETVDTIIDLGEGADAINQFLDYYEIGTGTTLTDEERTCLVDALVDKVTGSELNQAVAGNSSPELEQALGLAFLNCKISFS